MGNLSSKLKKKVTSSRGPSNSFLISTNYSNHSTRGDSISRGSSISDNSRSGSYGYSSDIDNFSSQEITSYQSILNQTVDMRHQQHFLYKHSWNGVFSSPVELNLKNGCKVIDVNCGPGSWLLDMASTYPLSHFHGIDVFTLFPVEIKPTNVEFTKIDSFTKQFPFEDNYFDYVRMPLMGDILKKHEWPIVLNELLRILKPDGYMELLEFDTGIFDAGPKISSFSDAFVSYLDDEDKYSKTPLELPKILSTLPQLENIKDDFRKLPTCYDNNDKTAELQFELLEHFFTVSIINIISKYMGITKKELKDLWSEFRIESKNYPNSYTKLHRIWAQKKFN